MINLKPINKENIDEIIVLKVGKQQEGFVSTVAESLAQAVVYKDTAFPFAIYEDETPVGFIMLGYYEKKHYYTLWKLLIDEKYQNKGYGQAALKLGIEYLKDNFKADRVFVGVVPDNKAAKRLYSSFGFVETGVIEDGMIEMCYETGVLKYPTNEKKNIVGGTVAGELYSVSPDIDTAHRTNAEFWNTVGSDLLGVTSLPSWSEFLPSEEKMNLLGDLTEKRVLEICCGNGRSLEYASKRGAAELWGLDISENQIAQAKKYLSAKKTKVNFLCSPMENECGIPTDYFDVVYSVFGIGWTTDLKTTFKLIHSYLKDGGSFIFSWSHPIHKCVSVENEKLVFNNSYFDEEWYRAEMGDSSIMLSNRMMSTYINALTDNGFVIEKLIEETDKEKARSANSDFGKKTLILPTAFVIKAMKEP